MNFCPECGEHLEFLETTDYVATFHSRFRCPRCIAEWEEIIEKGHVDKTLFITPIEGGDHNG